MNSDSPVQIIQETPPKAVFLWEKFADAAIKMYAKPYLEKHQSDSNRRVIRELYPKSGSGLRQGARLQKQRDRQTYTIARLGEIDSITPTTRE